jgi:glycosyltransferase involved in cell wall biosynthesis
LESKIRIVGCIPALNEQDTIARVIIRAKKHVDRVVVVDDGSTDDTAVIAEELGALVIRHGKNLGYGVAIRSCFAAARDLGADVLVTLDADGQHDPDQIPVLVEPIKSGSADLVVGSRFLSAASGRQPPRYRKAGIRLLTRATELVSDVALSDAQSGFRAYGRRGIDLIDPTEQGMGASLEILMRASEHDLRIVEVPISVRYEGLKTSTHNPVYHAIDVAMSALKFTSIRHPLMFYGGFAAAALALSAVFGLWALDLYAKEGRLVTNITLLSIGLGLVGMLALFTGIVLFTLISVVREKTWP